MLANFRGNHVEILQFASTHHALAATEITQIITDFITNVRHSPLNQEKTGNFDYLYVMDSILKQVQGNFISAFATNLIFVMNLVF